MGECRNRCFEVQIIVEGEAADEFLIETLYFVEIEEDCVQPSRRRPLLGFDILQSLTQDSFKRDAKIFRKRSVDS